MRILLLILLAIGYTNVYSQISPNKYYIELTDKNNNIYNLDNPENFLSERSIQRRVKQGIEINLTDLPVSDFYIDSLKSLGLEIINVSKWFNSVTVYSTDISLIDTICNLSFVKDKLKSNNRNINQISTKREIQKNSKRQPVLLKSQNDYYNYGQSINQIYLNNGQTLHNDGFRGKGMLIAVTDAGFQNLPELPAFDSLFAENRILATRNFVMGGNYVYDYSTHGMKVLSILAGNYPGQLIGSAPEASYLLLMSEDSHSETYIEEFNWVSAAEFADSLGADIINVSLGYVKFDNDMFSHSYSDMNGHTAISSKAATLAARKGIIVVASAANSGNSETHPWIAAPGDADSIITVGAVRENGLYTSFSSIGPSFDGRVKPDVVAMGHGTTNQAINGSISTGNGTSYAAPIISGLVACLWQKYPDKNNMEIIDAVRKSSNFYNNPTDTIGYGIPNFSIASNIIENYVNLYNDNQIFISPNPFKDEIEIVFKSNTDDSVKIQITDISGKVVYMNNLNLKTINNNTRVTINNLNSLPKGLYILSVFFINCNAKFSKKLIKE